MKSESQWKLIDYCKYCGCAIYEMDGKLLFTGKDCRCKIKSEDVEDGNTC